MENTVIISLRDPAVAAMFESVEPGDTMQVTLDIMVKAKDARKITASVDSVVQEDSEMEDEAEDTEEEAPAMPSMPMPPEES